MNAGLIGDGSTERSMPVSRGEDVPDWYIEQVARFMQLTNWHTYQFLTKQKCGINGGRWACLGHGR